MELKNPRFTSTFRGWKIFQTDLKSKLLQQFDVATLLFKYVLFLQLGLFFPQQSKTYCLSITTTMPFIFVPLRQSVRRTYVPIVDNNGLSNTFPGRSRTSILLKTALIFPVPARRTAPLKLSPMTLLLDSIVCETLPVPVNTMTSNSLFLPKVFLLVCS